VTRYSAWAGTENTRPGQRWQTVTNALASKTTITAVKSFKAQFLAAKAVAEKITKMYLNSERFQQKPSQWDRAP